MNKKIRVSLITDARTVHAQRWGSSLSSKIDELFVISVAAGEIEGCYVYNLNMINEKRVKILTLLKKIRYIFYCWIILLKKHPDIIHVHFLRPDITILGYIFYKNIFISVWGRDITDNQRGIIFFRKLFRKLALRRAKVVMATSVYLANETKKYCKNSNIYVVPFGIDLKKYKYKKKISRREKTTNVGYVKHLEAMYGPHVLAEAARYIIHPVRIFFVGQGSMFAELKAIIDKNNLRNIQLLGFVPNNELPKFLRKIDIFVMPTLYPESFGVSALEAQAVNVPVIASNVGGIREVVKHNVTGILIPPNDPYILAKTIDRLIEDDLLYHTLQNNCRNYIRSKFVWENNINKVIELYMQFI